MLGTSIDPFANMPAWLGTAPTWGIFLVVVVTLIKTRPLIQKNLLDAKERRENRYSQRITELEAAVRACQKECEEHKDALREEMRRIEERRLGDRAQHLQEQISLVSLLVKNIDNPLLDRILTQLQNAQRRLPFELTGVVGDKRDEGDVI